LNLGELRGQVTFLFGDVGNVRLPPGEVDKWINNAQLDIARKTEILKTAQVVSLQADRQEYPLSFIFIRVERVINQSNDRVLDFVSQQGLDDLYRHKTHKGEPEYYFIWGEREINFFPTPTSAQAGQQIKVFFIKEPPTLVNDSDVPEIPSYMHEELVRYALGKAKELDEDWEAAMALDKDYNNRLYQSIHDSHVQQADSFPAVRALPGDEG
jgi:hypothetical protein